MATLVEAADKHNRVMSVSSESWQNYLTATLERVPRPARRMRRQRKLVSVFVAAAVESRVQLEERTRMLVQDRPPC